MAEHTLAIGCVGDDFTGSSDAASFLRAGGMRTILCNGVPEDPGQLAGCDAAVIALKTRSVPAREAVDQTLASCDALEGLGARQLYFKYCSTFDSTPAGNIGPVCDSLLERAGITHTLLCPSLPVNGRAVRGGKLTVDGVPLHRSHMRHHPLNPMWDDEIAAIMAPQSRYPCIPLSREQLALPDAELRALVDGIAARHPRFYLVPDYEDERDGARIAALFGDLPLLTGGSALLEALARRQSEPARRGGAFGPVPGRAILLCGSCSKATLAQIRAWQADGGRSAAVDPAALLCGEQNMDSFWNLVDEDPDRPLLLYSLGAERGAQIHRDGADREAEAAALEQTMAALGRRAYERGFSRIVVAGGETSGAVMVALGLQAFHLGESVAPGVPVMIPVARPGLRLVLKSGNFGQEDFFARALALTGEGAR